jgi:hypothetical protein
MNVNLQSYCNIALQWLSIAKSYGALWSQLNKSKLDPLLRIFN